MWSKDYLAFSSFEALYQAHCVARKGKSKKTEVVRYELNLAEHLVDLERRLRSGKFDRFKTYSFYIYEPKVREVFATRYEGRIVLHSFCDNILMPEIDKRLIYDNGACRKGKGTHFTQKRLRKHYSDYHHKYGHSGYVLKCDISKYFESIDHDILKQKLSRVFEWDIFRFIEIIIDSYYPESQKGLPLGNQSSQIFALYYLDGMDRMIKEVAQMDYYVRYMDDFMIIHHDKEVLRKLPVEIEVCLESLKLRLNPKKQIYKIENGVNFLGFRFYLCESGKIVQRMCTDSKRRMIKRIHTVEDEYRLGLIEKGSYLSTLESYRGHLKHGDCWWLYQSICG